MIGDYLAPPPPRQAPPLNPTPTKLPSFPKGPGSQIVYTLAPKCLYIYIYRDYFKAKVCYYLGTWTLRDSAAAEGAKQWRGEARAS